RAIGGVTLAFALAGANAHAQGHLPSEDWRQADRGGYLFKREPSPQSFAAEIRLGTYLPNVDSDPNLQGRAPFASTFGCCADGVTTSCSPRPLFFGVELDWQVLRIPLIGSLGPGFGLGYTSVSAKAPLKSGKGLSAEDTSLMILPMHLSAVIR